MSDTAPSLSTLAQRASDWGSIVISLVVLMVFLAALTIAWKTSDASLPLLLGAASANATTAVGFWLGSSRGSQQKDTVIAAQATAPPKGTTP